MSAYFILSRVHLFYHTTQLGRNKQSTKVTTRFCQEILLVASIIRSLLNNKNAFSIWLYAGKMLRTFPAYI